MRWLSLALCVVAGAAGAADDPVLGPNAQTAAANAPMFSGLGTYERLVSTPVLRAGAYFNQGLVFYYGFNDPEAYRSFAAAAHQDPDCAMAYWGQALALWSYVKRPGDEVSDLAQDIIAKARKARYSNEVERGLIEAAAALYGKDAIHGFVKALGDLHNRFPADPDVAVLYAKALMDSDAPDVGVHKHDGSPDAATALGLLEQVLRGAPDHPGALHFYLHFSDYDKAPDQSLDVADRLRRLAPSVGHLLHMPAHVYAHVGRYHDASRSSQAAIVADDSYFGSGGIYDGYVTGSYLHHHHYLVGTAGMEGRGELVWKTLGRLSQITLASYKTMNPYWANVYLSLTPLMAVRFGWWDRIHSMYQPSDDLPYALAIWHYAQGWASIVEGKKDAAYTHLREVRWNPANPLGSVRSVLLPLVNLARIDLEARIAFAEGDAARAEHLLRQAVDIQDALPETEPPAWPMSARLALGQLLIGQKKYVEAMRVFQDDLEHNPANGWALFGLLQAQRLDGKTALALATAPMLQVAWQHADHELSTARPGY